MKYKNEKKVDETICEEVQSVCEKTEELIPEEVSSVVEPIPEKSGVWVYVGPTIRGIVTNGGIYVGTKNEVLARLPDGWKKYPKIERLLVSDAAVSRAKGQINEGKGGISVAFKELAAAIRNAAEEEVK